MTTANTGADGWHRTEAASLGVFYAARKETKFQTCKRHGWMDGLPRYRRAEFFCEGGPSHNMGCDGGTCRLWPGTDLFCESVCHGEMMLDWTVSTAGGTGRDKR